MAGSSMKRGDLNAYSKPTGLDRPVWEQFVVYVNGVIHLDFGQSYSTRRPVLIEVVERLPATAQLAASALILVMAIGIPLGLLAGVLTRDGRHTGLTVVFSGVTSAIGAVPGFLMATILSVVFAVWLHWLPVGAGPRVPLWQALILPAVSLAIGPVAVLSRIVRVETLNVLAQEYVRTARGKRLPQHVIYFRHVLPNTLTAAMTLGGLLMASLLGGAIIVENVFTWPGVGTRLVSAILVGDYPVVQGAALTLAFLVVIINAVVDALIAIFDPRTLNR